jgi:hypothetical protein
MVASFKVTELDALMTGLLQQSQDEHKAKLLERLSEIVTVSYDSVGVLPDGFELGAVNERVPALRLVDGASLMLSSPPRRPALAIRRGDGTCKRMYAAELALLLTAYTEGQTAAHAEWLFDRMITRMRDFAM